MQKLSYPRGGVSYLTFSPDGDILAGFWQNKDARPGLVQHKHALYCWSRSRDWGMTGLEHDGPITGLTFHPTGRTLAYAGIARGGSWRAPPAREPPAQTPSVWRRSFARESLHPFTGVHLYSLTGTDEFVPNRVRVPLAENAILAPGTWARGLAFTPDGRAMLSAQIELLGLMRTRANIYHWHFAEENGMWRVADPVAGCGATENGGALVGDACLALTGTWGVTVCPVAPATGLFVPDVRAASAVAVAPGRELVAVSETGSLTVWHLRTANPICKPDRAAGLVTALAFSPDGGTLAAGHAGNTVTFWDPLTGWAGPERDFGVGPVTALAYAPDGLTLAVAGRTGLVVVDTD